MPVLKANYHADEQPATPFPVRYTLAALGGWADAAGVAGLVVAVIGLGFLAVQLRRTAVSARAQATIQFQQAFHESEPARGEVLRSFPIYEHTLAEVAAIHGDLESVPTWRDRSDLSDADIEHAKDVIKALNDVAQYVADGLALRSAMQQYHTIFVRAGFLLAPFIDATNQSGQARWGVRVIDLLNAALAYHRSNPKHRHKELVLARGPLELVLIDKTGAGLAPHPGYPTRRSPLERLADRLNVRRALRGAERALRR